MQNIIFQNNENGYTIAEIITKTEALTIVGEMPFLCCGENIDVTGNFINHKTFGKQLAVVSYTSSMPIDKKAIVMYLSSGTLKGVGLTTAQRIVDKFGEQTFEIICTSPQKLAEVKGISPLKADEISSQYKKLFGLKEAVAYLTCLGIEPIFAITAYNTLGENTVKTVRQNPYTLCFAPILLDFGIADIIADKFSIDKDCSGRLTAGLYYVILHNQNNGHCCLPKDKLIQTVAGFTGSSPERIEDLILEEISAARMISVIKRDIDFIYTPEFYKAEHEISVRLLLLAKEGCPPPPEIEKAILSLEVLNGIEYAPLQKSAIIGALSNKIFILTGGPGTGKTTTLKAIISLFEQSAQRVSLSAPTGRAAKRMSELCKRNASTIHRLLEVNFNSKDEIRFVHNEKNPLKTDVVIVDEMSMVDIFLFLSLLRALPKKAILVMVGDHKQLPSVGPGTLLLSILASQKINSVALIEIFRQAQNSQIVQNAHRIINGEVPVCDNKTGDYYFINQSGISAQKTVLDLASKRLTAKYGYSSITDIQVLCATKIGFVGTTALNPLLQDLLNPKNDNKHELLAQGRIFRTGDKVMQIKNNYDLEYEKEGKPTGQGIFNGDIGFIRSINRRMGTIDIEVDDRMYIYTVEQLIEIEHAYAITVHKSQGNEFCAVILPLTDIPHKLCHRNLLYTAVTRAKNLLVTVGEGSVIKKMISDQKSSLRYSLIKDFLCEDN